MSIQTTLTEIEDEQHPFSRVDNGIIEPPTHPDWEYGGVTNQSDDQSMTYAADLPTPGYECSEKTLLVVEYTTFCPDYPFDAGFTVGLYPFDGNGEFEGMIQPRLTVGVYQRLREALRNVEQTLEKLAALEPGEGIIINDKPLRRPED